jgi:NOL1/NOP2/fmu family ribosome biogenesis protein
MKRLQILNKKNIKEILALMKKQWNAVVSLDYAFLKDTKDKIYIVNKEFVQVPLDKLRINKIGLYFGQLVHNELRLSIEGSQIVGKEAKKNVLEASKEQSRKWLRGEDLKTNEDVSGFVLIKHDKDFLGSGKFKQGGILNFVPKGRRLKTSE